MRARLPLRPRELRLLVRVLPDPDVPVDCWELFFRPDRGRLPRDEFVESGILLRTVSWVAAVPSHSAECRTQWSWLRWDYL